jgi:integration host factor subunit alpha
MALKKKDIAINLTESIRFKRKEKPRQQPLFRELNYSTLTQKRAREIVDSLFEIIMRNLEKGESVLISTFGKFQIRYKWATKGRNPRTGAPLLLDSRRIVTFRYSQKLKQKINQHARKNRGYGKGSRP